MWSVAAAWSVNNGRSGGRVRREPKVLLTHYLRCRSESQSSRNFCFRIFSWDIRFLVLIIMRLLYKPLFVRVHKSPSPLHNFFVMSSVLVWALVEHFWRKVPNVSRNTSAALADSSARARSKMISLCLTSRGTGWQSNSLWTPPCSQKKSAVTPPSPPLRK